MLTRRECTALRGFAILGIVLHNFCHWLRGAVQENEYTFSAANNQRLLDVLEHPDWDTPIQLLSFFGHYGVPVFLFLSGFGLVMKYESSPSPPHPSPFSFVKYNYLKLFRMMIIGWVFFLIIDRLTPGAHQYELLDIVAQLLMFNNLLPSPDKVIWPGPYWFFGLMMQLYIIYRLLIYRRHWAIAVSLAVLCIAIQVPFLHDEVTLNRLRYNCLSGMLPFVLGVLVARHKERLSALSLRWWHWTALLLLAVVLTLALCLHPFLWLWASAAIILADIALVRLLPSSLSGWAVWTGSVSAAMFVVHPALRKLFIPISHHGDVYVGLTLYLLSTLVIAWLLTTRIKKEKDKQQGVKQ